MATQVHVAKNTPVLIDDGLGGGLQTLGFTRNFAEVTKEAYWVDVPGDENGGDDGPPIDVIYLGETGRVRLELTKFDEAVANIVRARLQGATAGIPDTPGTLMFQDGKTLRVLLNSPNLPLNFPRAFCRDPIEIGKGTKFSSLILQFEAHKNAAGLLYDATTT